MKIFIDNASLLLLVLGHPVFTPLRPQTSGQVKNTLSKKKDKTDVTASKKERPASSAVSKKSTAAPAQGQNSDEEIIFRFKSKKVIATGRLSGNGFIVFKGSAIRPDERNSCAEYIREKRKKLIETQKIKDNVFVEDTSFESPAEATVVINGGGESANRMWIAEGKKLGDFRENAPQRKK